MLDGYMVLFQFMEVLGKRWVVPLLIILFVCETSTFTKIKKQLGVTSRALSKKLQLLETLGFIERIVLDSPRKIAYTLSDKGRQISEVLVTFTNFVMQ